MCNASSILSTVRQTYLGHYAFGIDSAIGSSFNFAPQLYHQINEAVGRNDVARARELQKIVTEIYVALFKHGETRCGGDALPGVFDKVF